MLFLALILNFRQVLNFIYKYLPCSERFGYSREQKQNKEKRCKILREIRRYKPRNDVNSSRRNIEWQARTWEFKR